MEKIILKSIDGKTHRVVKHPTMNGILVVLDQFEPQAYLCKLIVIPDGIYSTVVITDKKNTIEKDCKKIIPGLESVEIIKELGTPIVIN